MEKVQSYEEAWIKIKAATGIEDINELVKIFIMCVCVWGGCERLCTCLLLRPALLTT